MKEELLIIFIVFVKGDSLIAEKEVQLVNQPSNASLELGQTHVLLCIFTQEVACFWEQSSIPVLMGGRYGLAVEMNNSKVQTRNCSLIITNISERDEGPWICKGRYSKKYTSSKPAWLVISYKAEYVVAIIVPMCVAFFILPVIVAAIYYISKRYFVTTVYDCALQEMQDQLEYEDESQ